MIRQLKRWTKKVRKWNQQDFAKGSKLLLKSIEDLQAELSALWEMLRKR